MKEFISINLRTNYSDDEINKYVFQFFPDFKWRSGDSDMQGRYISGVDVDGVQIKLWLAERPVAMSISFHGLRLNLLDREPKKEEVVRRVRDTLIPMLGEIIDPDA